MYTESVQKIHKEFNTAGENLVRSAKAIIAKGLVNDADAQRLSDLGFSQCKNIKQQSDRRAICRRGLLAEEYSIKYPLYKFIDLDSVNKICTKYKLLFGASSKYIGKIPAKNAAEILAFKVKDEDLNEKIDMDWWVIGGLGLYESMMGRATKKEEKKKAVTHDRSFLICAPKKMMDLSNADIQGNTIVDRVSDPVVLHPVKGGYLIVTAWGDEASDEIVVNEINN